MSTANSEVSLSPDVKKQKLDSDSKSCNSIHDSITDLSSFKLKDVLQNNTNRKTVCLRGTFDAQEGEAVVILEKTAFSEKHFFNTTTNYFSEKNVLEKVFRNDIYGDYKYFLNSKLNDIKTTIIHPATDKHIVKFSSQNCYIVDETPTIYQEVILPHLTREQFNLQWVYNILEHKSESERIVYEDTDPNDGFLMVPDLKWNGQIETFYLLAIVNKHNIKSLRDLTNEHLSLLKNIQKRGIEAIQSKYGLDASQLRIYFHYQPSFYHLHVHFCYLRHEAPGILTEKAHLLSTVISNIELLPNYYQEVTIPFVVKENDNLFRTLESSGILNKCLPKPETTN